MPVIKVNPISAADGEDSGASGSGGSDSGNVRLVGGSSSASGRVEIYHQGQWGTICDDEWNLDEGYAVCIQLGFYGVTRVMGEGEFGPGDENSPIIEAVDCDGTQTTLEDCQIIGWGTTTCHHRQDAGVECLTGI